MGIKWNPFFLNCTRMIVPYLPRGKSLVIKTATKLFGTRFERPITLKDHTRFFVHQIKPMNKRLFFLGKRDPMIEIGLLASLVKLGDNVIDLGANLGEFSIALADLVGENGRVYAFELSSDLADEIVVNANLNNKGNVVVENVGVGEKNGEIDFYYSEKQGTANLAQGYLSGETKKERVKITTLDDYLESHAIKKVGFIKCDIDGSEMYFLRGARKTLATGPVMIIEATEDAQKLFGFTVRNLLDELRGLNYRIFNIEDGFSEIMTEDNGLVCANLLCLPKDKTNEILQKIKSEIKNA